MKMVGKKMDWGYCVCFDCGGGSRGNGRRIAKHQVKRKEKADWRKEWLERH